MSYIGNPIVSTDFPVDYFSGNGSTTAFTLSIAPASVNAVDVEVSGVSQSPQTYTISGTTLTFSAAPPSGTNNIVIKHRGVAGIPNVPATASVTSASLAAQDLVINGVTVGKGNYAATQSTALGTTALASANSSSDFNTAVGYQSAYSTTSGQGNTALGRKALYSNTTANDNTAVGNQALYTNSTGTANVAVGQNALVSNTTASNNTAVGYQAMYSNTTGTRGTSLGFQAGYNTTTAGYVVNIGSYAGWSYVASGTNGFNVNVGDSAGYSATGNQNTFIGDSSGSSMTTGSKNSILGRYNGNQGGLDIRTSSNYIVLSDGDGNPRIWADNIGRLWCPASYTYTTGNATNLSIASNGLIERSTSSIKYKRDVENATHGLSEVLQLRPVTYKGKSESDGDKVFGGLIAEEVHDAGLTEFVQYAPDGSPDALAYGNMVSLCIKAIQELKAEVDSLKQQLASK